ASPPTVPPNPAGRAPSNPGSDKATVSGRSSAASRPRQTAGVSGTPWTKTAVIARILPPRGRWISPHPAPDGGRLGHSMDKDGGHGSHTATAEELSHEATRATLMLACPCTE